MTPRILVVNDDQAILDLYCMLLEGERGYEVQLSLIAFEDVKVIEQMRPDLIILDAKLGNTYDGMLLLQKLKMYRPTEHIPVLLCTAAEQTIHQQEEAIRARGIPILYKPFDIDELLHLIEQMLSGEGTIS